jgi:hypothetical protein
MEKYLQISGLAAMSENGVKKRSDNGVFFSLFQATMRPNLALVNNDY